MKFPADLNYDEKVVCEMGHLPIIVRWIGCWHDSQPHTLPTKMIRCAMLAKTGLMGVCLCLEPWAPGAWPEGLYASRVGWCVLYFQRMGSGCCWHPYCFDNFTETQVWTWHWNYGIDQWLICCIYWLWIQRVIMFALVSNITADTPKLTGIWTLMMKRWVGLVKNLCI